MTVLPDFGYGEDNYILDHHDSKNKWKILTGLINDTNKFEWLMSFIQLKQLQAAVKQNKEDEEKARQLRIQ